MGRCADSRVRNVDEHARGSAHWPGSKHTGKGVLEAEAGKGGGLGDGGSGARNRAKHGDGDGDEEE